MSIEKMEKRHTKNMVNHDSKSQTKCINGLIYFENSVIPLTYGRRIHGIEFLSIAFYNQMVFFSVAFYQQKQKDIS